MQGRALRDVLALLKKRGVHTAVETALFVPENYLEMVMPYIDFFIVDVKILDRVECKEILGGELSFYLKNIETLYKANQLNLFRVPCCPEYTFTEKNKKIIFEFLKKYRSVPVQLFEIHGLGEKKYESLNRVMWKSRGIRENELPEYQNFLLSQGIKADVIQI